MRGRKDDGTPCLSQIIYAIIEDIICQASVAVRPEPLLVVSDPVQIALLNGSPSINHILLEQSSCTKDVVRLDCSWTDVKAIGIIQQLGDFFCTSRCTLIDIHRDVKMPALLTRREEEDIVKGGIGMTELADAAELTTLESQDDVAFVRNLLRSISRNDGGNFIGSRNIVSSAISAWLEVNADLNVSVLLWRLLYHDLIGCLIKLSIGMASVQHVMELSENSRIKIAISVDTNIGGMLCIKDIKLSIGRLLIFSRHKTSHEVMERSMDAKGAWARALNSMIIDFDTNRGKCHSTVVLTNVGDKCTLLIQLLELRRPW
jgi:hypothetical protein